MSNSVSDKLYLMANDLDVAWGLTVTTVGRQEVAPHTLYPSGSHPQRYLFSTEKGRILQEYQLIYITRGSGWFASAHQKKTAVRAGDLFLLFPGEWHNYAPDSKTGWREAWIGFTGENMDKRVRANFFCVDKSIFNIGILEEVVQYYKLAIQAAAAQKTGYQQHLAGLVNMLLGAAYSMDKELAFQQMEVDSQINQAKVFMQENLEKNIPGEAVAGAVNMGYSRFRKVFREYTGFAPAQYMQELKMTKSKELLTNTSMTCQQIAYSLGFESPSYFNVSFRRRTGMTPSDYRDMTQGRRLYDHYRHLGK